MKRFVLSLSLALFLPLLGFSQTPVFSTHTAAATPAYILLHGDLNGDGFEDLIGYNSNNAFYVFLSNGDGTYRAPITYNVANASDSPALLGDFNDDGKLDLVMLNNYGNTGEFSIYFGNGDGTFGAPVSHVTTGAIASLAAADVNHDNKTDLLVDFSTDGGNTMDVQVLFSNGDGTFRTGPTTYNTNAGSGILAGDFNGDGKVDIAAKNGSEGGSYIGILIGDDTGNFTKTYSDSTGYNVLYVAADINGDGITDIVGTTDIYSTNAVMQQPYLYAYFGKSDGTMTPAQIPTQDCGIDNVAVADFNGDGLPDIAIMETGCTYSTDSTTIVNILPGKGNNQFGPETTIYSTSDYTGKLNALRGNRDTKSDLVLSHSNPASTNTNILTTLLNDTTGNFPTCAAPDAATGIAVCSPQASSTVSSPVDFAIGAAGAVKMRKVEVWIDGNKAAEQLKGEFSNYSYLDASVPLATGAHNVTVYAAGVDNSLQSKSFTLNVASSSCSVPTSAGVRVCSPANGSTDTSPVNVQAAGTVTGTLARMEVWVDGVKEYTSTTSNLNTSLPLAAGSHRFDFYAVNTAGQKWETTVYATVSTGQTTCSAPGSAGVHVCSPANGSTVASPVSVEAASTVTGTIARMEVWVDGVKKYTSTTTSLNTSLSVAAGSHRFDFYAVNTAGQKWETTTHSTVQ